MMEQQMRLIQQEQEEMEQLEQARDEEQMESDTEFEKELQNFRERLDFVAK